MSAWKAVTNWNRQLPRGIVFHLTFTSVGGLWRIMHILQCFFWKVDLIPSYVTQKCFLFPLPPLMTSELSIPVCFPRLVFLHFSQIKSFSFISLPPKHLPPILTNTVTEVHCAYTLDTWCYAVIELQCFGTTVPHDYTNLRQALCSTHPRTPTGLFWYH